MDEMKNFEINERMNGKFRRKSILKGESIVGLTLYCQAPPTPKWGGVLI